MTIRTWPGWLIVVFLSGCGVSRLESACEAWVDEVNDRSCMSGDLGLDLEDSCNEGLMKSYVDAGCKDSALEYFDCFIPFCDDNDFPDWPTDCTAVCNLQEE